MPTPVDHRPPSLPSPWRLDPASVTSLGSCSVAERWFVARGPDSETCRQRVEARSPPPPCTHISEEAVWPRLADLDGQVAPSPLRLAPRILVLKRLGLSNREITLGVWQHWTICQNHLRHLTVEFRLGPGCHLCEGVLPLSESGGWVEPRWQDAFSPFCPALLTGCPLCSDCHRRLGQAFARLAPSNAASLHQVRAILQWVGLGQHLRALGPWTGSSVDPLLASMPQPCPWSVISLNDPFVTVRSRVPPLRLLARGIGSGYSTPSPPYSLTILECLELFSPGQLSKSEALPDWSTRWMDLACSEYRVCAELGGGIRDKVKSLYNMSVEHEKRTGFWVKLKLFLQLKVEQLIYIPDDIHESDALMSVLYRTNEESAPISTLCLSCPDLKCAGCRDLAPIMLPHRSKSYQTAIGGGKQFSCWSTHEGTQELALLSTSCSVPSLRLLATGFKRSSCTMGTKMWRHVTIAVVLDFCQSFGHIGSSHRLVREQDGCDHDVFVELRARNILMGTSVEALFQKVKAILALLSGLAEDLVDVFPEQVGKIAQKMRLILGSLFFFSEPLSHLTRIGMRRHDWPSETQMFVCCACPNLDCSGNCIVTYVPFKTRGLGLPAREVSNRHLPTVPNQTKDKAGLHSKIDESGVALPTNPCALLPINGDSSQGYREAIPGTLSPDNASQSQNESLSARLMLKPTLSTYSLNSQSLSLHLGPRDSDVTIKYFESETILDGLWEVFRLSDEELLLQRQDQEVRADLERLGGAINWTLHGSAISAFVDEILPCLLKMFPISLVEDKRPSSDSSSLERVTLNGHSPLGLKVEGHDLVEPKKETEYPEELLEDHEIKLENPEMLEHDDFLNELGMQALSEDAPSAGNIPKAPPLSPKMDDYLDFSEALDLFPRLNEYSTPDEQTEKARPVQSHSATLGKRKKALVVPQILKKPRIDSVVSLRKKTEKKSPKPVAKARPRKLVDYHKPICKLGHYSCPICGTVFRLNQPYGKHVTQRDCSKIKRDKRAPSVAEFTLLHVSIHPGREGSDSTIGYGRVPSLRMLCRGMQMPSPLILPHQLPALTNKECLEINFALKRSDKAFEREERWKYLSKRHIFHFIGNCTMFLALGASVLKVVDLLERKIKAAKSKPDLNLVHQWNRKLTTFLSIPFHDHLNTASVSGKFKAYEYPSGGAPRPMLKVLCLQCPVQDCPGCAEVGASHKVGPKKRKHVKKPFVHAAPAPVISAKTAAGAKQKQGNKHQKAYFSALGVWKTKAQLKQSCLIVGEHLGYKRPATYSEVIKYDLQHPGTQPKAKTKSKRVAPAQKKRAPRKARQDQAHLTVIQTKSQIDSTAVSAGDSSKDPIVVRGTTMGLLEDASVESVPFLTPWTLAPGRSEPKLGIPLSTGEDAADECILPD